MMNRLSIIVSVYNEEAVLDQFYEHIIPVLDKTVDDYELIFVNDGSRDMSPAILDRFAIENHRVKVIHFSRNYGHEAAMIAGIDYSSGDGIICMDADLQHPVECIPKIWECFQEGYEVISMVRLENKHIPIWKKITSVIFYKLMNHMSEITFEENASDFFAMTRKPAEVLKHHFRESSRYLRAYVQSIGFKKTSIEYNAQDRVAGKSKYNFKKLFRFSISAMISFSNLPLRIASACGTISGLMCVILIVYTVYSKLVHGTPSGYATLIVLISFMFTILFFLLGIMGEYLAVILAETRKRPLYIVSEYVNFEEDREDDESQKMDQQSIS